jgi:hypothetical protein
MIRLTHLTGSRQGEVDSSPKAVVRIGRAGDCDVRFDGNVDRTVSSHHAEIRFDGSGYVLVDTQSSNGTLVNGRRISQHELKLGDVIHIGGDAGPQLRFELADSQAPAPRAPKSPPAGPKPVDDDVMNAAAQAVAKARAGRQATGGQATGQTMFIMLDAINQTVEKKKGDYRKVGLIAGGIAFLIIGTLIGVVLWQQAQLNGKVDTKSKLDTEIAQIQAQLQIESDEARLAELVARLELLTGQAATVTEELESSDKGQQALAKAGLDGGSSFSIDREIKKILGEFEADTYTIPPHFKQRVEFYIGEWADPRTKKANGHLRKIWERRKQYWPMIQRAFMEERVPEPMAYVAWQESQFDPEICSWVGARGMWQFMPATGKRYGLEISSDCERVRPASGEVHCPCSGDDDRTDPYKAAKAGARYLGDLLAEFGIESFMLAIASYNKGEEGMRRILRERKLRRRSERDFWHLYYLKLLPEETLEYVPRIVAAAIIGRNPREFGLD